MHSTRTGFQQLRSVPLPVFVPRVAALLVVASFAALGTFGCDNQVDVESGSGAPSTGGGSGSSTGAGSGGTAGSGGKGVGATSTGGTAGSGATTTSTSTTKPECVVDSDCLFVKPYCEPQTGICVACLIGPSDICPPTSYCSKTPTGNACVPGCNDDADCNAGPEPDVFTCDPIAHQCLGCSADEHCPPGSICDAATNQCKLGCSPQKPCDPVSIKPDCCGSTCANLLGDVANCGTCGNACEVNLPNATGICSLGTCKLTCNVIDKIDCNKVVEDGCELDVGSDLNNCGGCGNKCATGPHVLASCIAGQCASTCEPGFADCDGIDSNGCEANLTSDPSNCGGCGNLCFGQGTCAFACVGGLCSSASCACPFADCDGNVANGCETDTSTDVAHCGSCQTACGAGQVCTAGSCL